MPAEGLQQQRWPWALTGHHWGRLVTAQTHISSRELCLWPLNYLSLAVSFPPASGDFDEINAARGRWNRLTAAAFKQATYKGREFNDIRVRAAILNVNLSPQVIRKTHSLFFYSELILSLAKRGRMSLRETGCLTPIVFKKKHIFHLVLWQRVKVSSLSSSLLFKYYFKL